MSAGTLTETVMATALPRVNLLPPEIAEARRLRRAQLGVVGIVALALVCVGGLYYQARGDVTRANARLTATQAQGASLRAQIAHYDFVTRTRAQVQQAQSALDSAMAGQILWSRYLDDLSLDIPNNVWLTSMTLTEQPGGVAATAPNPFTPGGVATVDFTGVAFTADDVASWLDSLAKIPGFADPAFSSYTTGVIDGHQTVTFTSSVVVTSSALSQRFTSNAGRIQ